MNNDFLEEIKNIKIKEFTPIEKVALEVRPSQKNSLLLITAEYIRKSELLRIAINKEQDPSLMLDKALLCISYMTGDTLFYKSNISKFK